MNDLKQDVVEALVEEVNRGNQSGAKLQWQALDSEFRGLLKNYDRSKIVARAKSAGIYSNAVEEALDKVERFSKTKQL